MKRILLTAMASLATLIAVCSCSGNIREQDYTFTFELASNMSSDDEDAKARYEQILELVQNVEYFTTDRTYFGTYTDTCLQCYNDFLENTEKLDGKAIAALLEGEEMVALAAVCNYSGEIVSYMFWTSGMFEESTQ